MSLKFLIEAAIKEQKCSQKELAEMLDVSSAQISKWKNNEHISFEMQNKLLSMANIEMDLLRSVEWSGSVKNAKLWNEVVELIGKNKNFANESGFEIEMLENPDYQLTDIVTYGLSEAGIIAPEVLFDDMEGLERESLWDLTNQNDFLKMIKRLIGEYSSLYGFYMMHIENLINEEVFEDKEWQLAFDLDLILLALVKCGENKYAGKDFKLFEMQTIARFEKIIGDIKATAFENGIPLSSELNGLIEKDAEMLESESEDKFTGKMGKMIHPDIYMNELILGTRAINAILPLICNKLDISDEDIMKELQSIIEGESKEESIVDKVKLSVH